MEDAKADCLEIGQHAGTSAVLCRLLSRLLPEDWEPGPAPICQPAGEEGRRRGLHERTDEAARKTLVSEDLAPVLYPVGRVWRRVDQEVSGVRVLALELCPVDDSGRQVLAVHINGPSASRLARASHDPDVTEFWEVVRSEYVNGASYDKSPVRAITFLPGPKDRRLAQAYEAVTGITQSETRAARHSLTIDRPDWSALVLRDGVGIVFHPTQDPAFGPHLRVLTHSIYLDALLLAWIQRILLDESGSRAVAARLDVPDELVELERLHFDFKRRVWRRSLTHKRTAPVDELLVALQRELLTDRDIEDVEERVQDGARLARTLSQEKASHAQDALNRLVQRAAVIIGALGLAYAAAPSVAQPSWPLFAWATVAGLVAMLIALTVMSVLNKRVDRPSGRDETETSRPDRTDVAP